MQPAFVIVGPDGATQTLAGAVDDATIDSLLTATTGA